MAGTGLRRILEGDIEIRVAGGDAFHDIFVTKPHHISNVSPVFIQDCELHDGAFGKVGSIICWKYTLDGKVQSSKQILEVIDEDNKIIKFNLIEGELREVYKSFVATYQVIPKDEHKCLVKWIFEYEKVSQDIPEPSSLMDTLINLAKEICDHHHGESGN